MASCCRVGTHSNNAGAASNDMTAEGTSRASSSRSRNSYKELKKPGASCAGFANSLVIKKLPPTGADKGIIILHKGANIFKGGGRLGDHQGPTSRPATGRGVVASNAHSMGMRPSVAAVRHASMPE